MMQALLVDEVSGAPLLDLTADVRSATVSRNRHGSARIALTLEAPGLAAAQEIRRLRGAPELLITDRGRIVARGRLEDRGIRAGVDLAAYGYQNALRDTLYTAVWSDVSLERWRPITAFERGDTQPDRWETDTQTNGLSVSPKEGETLGGGLTAFWWLYQVPSQSTREIAGLQYRLRHLLPSSSWKIEIWRLNEAFSASGPVSSFSGTGATADIAASLLFVTSTRYIGLKIYYDAASAAYAASTGTHWVRFTNLRVVSLDAYRPNTTLAAGAAAGATTISVTSAADLYVGQEIVLNSAGALSEIRTVTAISGTTISIGPALTNNHSGGESVTGFFASADQIIGDLVANVRASNPSQLSASLARVQASDYDLMDAVYEDMRPAAILDLLEIRGSQSALRWRWRVDDHKALCWAPEQSGRIWDVDAEEIEIEESIADMYNAVYATYSEAGGRALRTSVETDAISQTRRRLVRQLAATAGNTTDATNAERVRSAVLADAARLQPRIRIPVRHVFDRSGGEYPPDVVSPGDTIRIRNLDLAQSVHDNDRAFAIEEVEIDLRSGEVVIVPANPAPTLELLLARPRPTRYAAQPTVRAPGARRIEA